MQYRAYLKSPQWKQKRKEAIDRAGGVCQLCGKRRALTVHHNNYQNLGRELPSDLIAICWPCHQSFHRKQRTAKDIRDNLTPKARQLIRRLNLEPQKVMLTASERRRRAAHALRFLAST